jgi:phosphoribosylaminoimidazole-succinocarboxamide synthase
MSGGRVGSHRAEDAAEAAGAEVAPLLPGYSHIYSGKVRDLYAPVDPATGHARSGELLLVATDRISVFDYVLDTLVPDKGRVLTQLSLWWFEQLAEIVPHHVLSTDVPGAVEGRAVLVRRLRMVPVECVARAYLTGGGLTEYEAGGSVSGVPLPSGLIDGSALPATAFTPSTKAPMGQHDEPIGYDVVSGMVGGPMAARLRDLTVAVLDRGNDLARERGILIADTKVEFGLDLPDSADWSEADPQGLVLADEVLTPDSSRFWPADLWSPGARQPSYDKQYVRDWLTSPESGWSRSSGEPPPPLPDEIVERTRDRYVEAYERLTRRTFT